MKQRLSCLFVPLVLASLALAMPADDLTPAPPQEAPSTQAGPESFPVRLEGEVIFRVRNALGPFNAEERAALAEERLRRIADDPFYGPEQFEIRSSASEGQLLYRGEVVAVVTAQDALAIGLPIEELMAGGVGKIEHAIARYRARHLPEARVRAALSFAAATALMLGLLWGVRRLHCRMVARAAEARQTGLAAKLNQRLGLSADKLAEYQLRLLRLLRAFLVLVVVLAYLQAAFSVVPLTRRYSIAMLGYLLAPLERLWQGLLANVGDLFFILVMVALTFYVLRTMRWLAAEARRGAVRLPGVEPEWAVPLFKIARLAVVAVAAVMIYPYIPGSSSAAFKGISLFAGALFTLGASGTAGNFIGGIVLVFMGLYRLGDRIRLGEMVGEVVEMNLMLTRVRTPKNEIVSIPNSSILGGQLVNYSTRARQEGLILHTTVGIGYDAPWRTVHRLLLEAARKTEGLQQEPAPFVLQLALGDFAVTYELNAFTKRIGEILRIYSDLLQNIQDEFNRAGVQIMSPHYENDPAAPKLVPPESWEATPGAVRRVAPEAP